MRKFAARAALEGVMSIESQQLGPNENPPDEDHVLVTDEPGGWATVVGSVTLGEEVKFWTPPAFDDWSKAFEAAEDWANANGVTKIYTKRKSRSS